ncbi:PadR family transcriptional regulator [Actinocorallia sp. A-T 12471]|uniref:PadR family transcriptional regulator n=1 Tax=Actinocorallia sp. A-T 12471 TaxID=3089813 RepID=UPI0029D38BED|nr:PadR family transcriptional regulator [Actinocorallia sp. A-T 12471]MDX6739719.1 PadR family transcriptional regulator [Actinocorallia sp. A-T 12471]
MKGRRHGWPGSGPDFLFGWGGGQQNPPWAQPGFPFGPPPPKAKRGDVRAAILVLLTEGPRNGYQIIQDVVERTEGSWKPSPGAVYPALQQLSDEGLIRGDEADGRKTYELTDAGREHVAQHPPEAPWNDRPKADTTGWPGGEATAVFGEMAQLGKALIQVVQAGSPAQVAEARRVLGDTRRRLYGILATDIHEEDA